MLVTSHGTLEPEPPLHPVLRIGATLVSWLLHPLLLIVWVLLYLLFENPNVFLGWLPDKKVLVLLRIASTSVFLPLVTVLLLKGLGFVQSIRLETRKERIVPIIASLTFFFWSYYVSKQLNDPMELRAFLLGLFVSACSALVMNNYFKVSLHTLGAGGMLAFFTLLLLSGQLQSGLWFVGILLAAGAIGSSRLLLRNHIAFDVYMGYIVGILIQVVCWWIVG